MKRGKWSRIGIFIEDELSFYGNEQLPTPDESSAEVT